MKEIRAAGYCSIGTREELVKNDPMSIDRQKRAILTYKDEHGYPFTSFYVQKKAPGKAGEDRDPIGLLIKDARDGKFNIVIVKRHDRLSNDMFYRYWVEKELMKLGVKVIAIEPHAAGEAQQEEEALCRRVIEAFVEFENPGGARTFAPVKKIKTRQTPQNSNGQSAYGWRKVEFNGKSQVIPHQEEQLHLETMCKLQDMGLSDSEIAVLLTEGGYIENTWFDRVKPRESEKWDSDMIRAAIEHTPDQG
jgi:hypothetical protein